MSALHVVGMNDEQTVCDRCGKVELRGTVILADEDSLEAGRYGTTCASKVLEEANGTRVRVTRDDAWRLELNRRTEVQHYLSHALKCLDSDPAIAQCIVSQMRRNPLAFVHLPDEIAAVHKIDTTGFYVPLIPARNVSGDGVRRNYARRVESGKARVGTSASYEWGVEHGLSV